MNNIEIEELKRDLKKYLGFSDKQVNEIYKLQETKIISLKNEIHKIKNKKSIEYEIKRKINKIFSENPTLNNKRIIKTINDDKQIINDNKQIINQIEPEDNSPIKINGRKPKILFISDVKGWAWWIKSEYIKKYLSDEFDIDIEYLINNNNTYRFDKINQKKYDLYFTYGFSYIDFLTQVPKKRKITGVTAHRARNVIQPKMKIAGYQHANSIMLLKELKDMGFNNAYYVPNGVDEELFKPIKPIEKKGELVVGHVGKETPLKGQREFIIPAIQSCGVKSYTNLRTWKDKLPHTEMPKLYNEMDLFVVASVEDGTPNPALEAAACGRPIISNAIGNMPEFIKNGYNGFIVPRKISAYVEKINYFKNNRNELIRMGNNARKTVEESWTWKHQSEYYRNMFKKIFEIQK